MIVLFGGLGVQTKDGLWS